MACIVAQHDRIQPTTIRASLIHPPKGPTGTQQEKLGRPAATTCPQPRQSRSTHASTFSQARRWIKAKEELLQLLMLSVMRLEGRVVVLERRSEAGTEFLEALAEIFPKQS
jgi:hypothetical protein